MKISLKWLDTFFPALEKKSGLAELSAELRTKLPLAGIEVASWKNPGAGLEQVVVAQILDFKKHPGADRLNVCQVKFSDTAAPLQIVCGAPNVRANIKVALAPVGSVLPGDFKIKEAQIRGVNSSGMLCSEKELGFSQESDGILILPDSAPVGVSLIKALGLSDEIWDLELTPDRGDCLSHLGVAREISRWVGQTPTLPEIDVLNPKDKNEVPMLGVEVQAPKACPIYGAQLFENIQNIPSPDWLRLRLEALGTRSHNAVVNVTNYVLLELGHPLHAFDADKIRGSKIIVRFAKENEQIRTLDDVVVSLKSTDLVIADLEGPLAIAGIMGSKESGVSETTKRVVLETAIFDPELIRATATRLKLQSDSSYRFERGVDASGKLIAAGRAALLLRQLTGARKRGSYLEIVSAAAEEMFAPKSLNFDLRAFKDVTGMDIPAEVIARNFQQVSIPAQVKSTNVIRVDVPSHRFDLKREIDLTEEAARLLGYDQIPERYPRQETFARSSTRSLYLKLRQIRHRVLETGLSEMMPYNFISSAQAKYLPDAKGLVEIQNPLSADWQFMRPCLSFGLIGVCARHAALGQLQGGFCDTGHVFELDKDEPSARSTGTKEAFHAGVALMGLRKSEHWSDDKTNEGRKAQVDYFDAKGALEEIVKGLGAIEAKWGATQYRLLNDFLADEALCKELQEQAPWIPLKLLHPQRSAILYWPAKPPGIIVGFVGELHPSFRSELLNLPKGLQLGVVLGEIRVLGDLRAAMESARVPKEAPVSPRGSLQLSRRLPVVQRDLALVVDSGVLAADLDKTLRRAAGVELLKLECLDIFKLPSGKVSMAFRVHLQGQTSTLSEEDIATVVKRVLQGAREKHGAELR